MKRKVPPVLRGAESIVWVGVGSVLIWIFAAGVVLFGCWLGGWL